MATPVVSGFLAAGAGESGSATLTPSPFANTDAALNILMPSAHWLKSHAWLHSLPGHVSTFSLCEGKPQI